MEEKTQWKKVAIGAVMVASFSLPIFRSGGRTGLTFWGWIINHTVYGPPVEYIPEESYRRELEGVEITKLTSPARRGKKSDIAQVSAFYQISEASAKELLSHAR